MEWLRTKNVLLILTLVPQLVFAREGSQIQQHAVRSGEIPENLYEIEKVGPEYSVENQLIGRGFDSVLGEFKKASCVEVLPGTPALGRPIAAPQTTMNIERITDDQTFVASTEISAAAAYNWSGGKGDAASKYLLGNKFSTYSSYALQNVEVLYPEQSYNQAQFRLSKFGKDLLKVPGGNAIFRFTCGDRFTVGLRYGGQFKAVISAQARTTEEQQQVENEISASSVQGGMSASLRQRFESLQMTGSLRIDILRDGLEEIFPRMDINSLSEYSLKFPEKIGAAQEKPVRDLITVDYVPLLLQVAHGELPATPAWATLLSDQFVYLRGLAKYRADLVYIRDHKDQFVTFDERPLSSKLEQVNNAMDKLISWASECIRSRGAVCPDNKSTNIGIPKYAPVRARDWVKNLDPRSHVEQPIGETLPSFPMTLELRGRWFYGRGGNDIHPITFSTELHLQNKGNPADKRTITGLQYSHLIPENFMVSFRFADIPGNYGDNAVYQPDPAQARLGGALETFFTGN